MIGVCRQRPANVKRWRDGDMAMRWCAAGMVEAGKQFRRVNGHLHLASLRAALEREAAESVGATCHDDLVFMWSDRRRARRSPVRVADLIAAFGARRTGLRLAAAAISVTAAGRDGSRSQRRCQDQEHSAPRARVPGRSRPVAAPSAGSLAGDNHAGILSLRRVTVKVQGRVVAAPAPVGGHQPAGRLAGVPAARVWPPGASSSPARNRLCRRP